MSFNSIVPTTALVVNKIAFSHKTIGEWNLATESVKEAQSRFLRAYRSSITDICGEGWENTWRTMPNFSTCLREIEKEMKRYCTAGGMSASVFTRYQSAARKHCFLDVPFNFGTTLSLDEIRQAKEIAEKEPGTNSKEKLRQALKTVREQKYIQKAASKVSRVATVLPLPEPEVHPEDFLNDQVLPQLESYLQKIENQFGKDFVLQILERMAAVRRADGSRTESEQPTQEPLHEIADHESDQA